MSTSQVSISRRAAASASGCFISSWRCAWSGSTRSNTEVRGVDDGGALLALDADHIGTQVAEQLRGRRPGQHPGEIRHTDPVQRAPIVVVPARRCFNQAAGVAIACLGGRRRPRREHLIERRVDTGRRTRRDGPRSAGVAPANQPARQSNRAGLARCSAIRHARAVRCCRAGRQDVGEEPPVRELRVGADLSDVEHPAEGHMPLLGLPPHLARILGAGSTAARRPSPRPR